MKITIEHTYDNGDCWCGPTYVRLVVQDGGIVENVSSGLCSWQEGLASDDRPYGQYLRGIELLKAWSRSKLFKRLSLAEKVERVVVAAFLGDPRGRKSPEWWRVAEKPPMWYTNGTVCASEINKFPLSRGYGDSVTIEP